MAQSKAIQELRRLKLESLKAKSSMPLDELESIAKNHKYSDTTANGLTACIIDFLSFMGGYANRINVQGRELPAKTTKNVVGQTIELSGRKRIKSTTNVGTGDIHAIWQGLHLSIEVKIGADRQSEAQRKEQQRIEAAGGLYFIAKDFDSFYTWFTTSVQHRRIA